MAARARVGSDMWGRCGIRRARGTRWAGAEQPLQADLVGSLVLDKTILELEWMGSLDLGKASRELVGSQDQGTYTLGAELVGNPGQSMAP